MARCRLLLIGGIRRCILWWEILRPILSSYIVLLRRRVELLRLGRRHGIRRSILCTKLARCIVAARILHILWRPDVPRRLGILPHVN